MLRVRRPPTAGLVGMAALLVGVLSSLVGARALVAPGVARAANVRNAGRSPRAVTAKELTAMLSGSIRQAGSASGAYVVDLNTGQVLYAYKPQTGRLPASVEKLYTTSTALLRYGPTATLTTRIFGTGSLSSTGVWHGTLYLKGGGDPTFGSRSFDQSNYGTGATVQQLVSNLLSASPIKAVQGKIVADGSWFDAARGTPATGYAPSLEVEGVLDGIAFNRGWWNSTGTVFQAHPTLYAAQRFAAALRSAGVRVPAKTKLTAGRTPSTATQLAVVHSPDIATLLQLTNTPSDNYFAETLLKDLGASFGGAGTTAAGAAVVRSEVASEFGIHPRFNDGSGLSYYDSTSPQQVVTLLEHMAGNSTFVNSLAIAGETGTLQPVDPASVARGRCRGKTGTLAAVANVVGYCQALDGHTLAYAFLVNDNAATDYVHNTVEGNMLNALASYDG